MPLTGEKEKVSLQVSEKGNLVVIYCEKERSILVPCTLALEV